jgi:ABC-type Fe3+-citrate transport system substrate-binding protein
VKQKPGIIPDMMAWMKNEAGRLQIEKEGFYGGLLLDEMSIQEDLQIGNQGKITSFYRLVDREPEVMLMHHITEGKFESKLANHVIQYIFHG